METDELVEEVLDISNVHDEDADEDIVLKYLNRGNLTLASSLLLPWLIEMESVNTVIGEFSADVPENYHRNLFQATYDNNGTVTEVLLYHGLRDLAGVFGTINNDPGSGTVKAVCVSGRKLIYQHVPPTPVEMTLFYYGFPAKLEDEAPAWDNADFDQALINFACWKVAEKVEDGSEGKRVNTEYHKTIFDELSDTLKIFCVRYGENYIVNAPSINKTW